MVQGSVKNHRLVATIERGLGRWRAFQASPTMLRTVPGREEFARVAYRGLKPTATVNGRYATGIRQLLRL